MNRREDPAPHALPRLRTRELCLDPTQRALVLDLDKFILRGIINDEVTHSQIH